MEYDKLKKDQTFKWDILSQNEVENITSCKPKLEREVVISWNEGPVTDMPL